MNYARRLLASILLTIVATLALLSLAPTPADAYECVGVDLTVTVLGQPYPLLTNSCSFCFISQGPNEVWVNPLGLAQASVTSFACFYG